jgi:hypothetical protein
MVRSSNLTPDPTDLGARSRENFISLFRSFADAPSVPCRSGGGATPSCPGSPTRA